MASLSAYAPGSSTLVVSTEGRALLTPSSHRRKTEPMTPTSPLMEDPGDIELLAVQKAIFASVNSSSRPALRSTLLSTDPSSILQSLLVTSYDNADGGYGHDPGDTMDAQELLGLSCTHLNVLQIACFLGEEDMACDILQFVADEVGGDGARKVLFEFMGRIWGDGNVSLHLASFMGMSTLVGLLLDCGANPNKRNGRGYRAVDCADDDATLSLFQSLSQVVRIPMPSQRNALPGDECISSSPSADPLNPIPHPSGLFTHGGLSACHTDPSDIPISPNSPPSGRVVNSALPAPPSDPSPSPLPKALREEASPSSPASIGSPSERVTSSINRILSALTIFSSPSTMTPTTPNVETPPSLGGVLRKGSSKKGPRKRVVFAPEALVFDAAHTGDVEGLCAVLDLHPHLLNARIPGRELTPLHVAASYSHTRMVRTLLNRQVEVEAADIEGWTPLLCAAAEGDVEVVRMLCDHGASVHARTGEGESILEIGDGDEMLALLREAGAIDP